MTQEEIIQNEINNIVPAMIEQAVSSHTHTGQDSQILQGQYLSQAPQSSLTTASSSTLSTGGAAVLSTADSTILTNAILRIAELESKLKALGLIN